MASDAGPGNAVNGAWYPASASRAMPARMVPDDASRFIVTGEAGTLLASGSFSELQISSRVGSIPRRVTFADGSVFETDDNDGLDRLLVPYLRRGAGAIHALERFHPRLAIFVVLVVALAFSIYRFAVPALVEIAVLVTPPVVTHLLSQSVMTSLDQTVFDPSGLDEKTRQDIADGFASLSAITPLGSDHFALNFRKGGTVGPNAFALPDGTLVLTDELVELAKDKEAVLGVLAHEIGHVEHQHSLRQLYRAAGVTGLILLIGGDIGGGVEDILIQGSAVTSLSHSRAAEAEADRYSVELMLKAGHDPSAIARFFELLRDHFHDDSRNDFFSTHPATPERIDETRRYAEELKALQSQ